MFRRKEEGTDEMFQESTSSVQVPPAPQSDAASAADATAVDAPATTGNDASATSPASPYGATAAAFKPAAPVAAPAAASPFRAPTAAPSASSNVTDMSNRNRFAETRTPTGSTSTMDKTSAKSGSRRILTVGHDILMKGEINSCDRIVIEGAVDATLKDVHTMEISETGSFKGIAEVEEAEISGTVEGDLNVRGRLIIYATGKVSGKVTYGEIEIERGGQLTGEIKTSGSAASSGTKAAA